jgi:caffeoyl-CoA O-methyltransferase
LSDDIKSLGLGKELHAYLVAHGTPPDPLLAELREVTQEKVGGMALMQIAPEQGAFMTLLTRLLDARLAVEVGTFTGYSALCIARGLPADGRLVCCDVSEEWTSIGRPYWEKAGVADRIDLRIAPALETLEALPEKRSIDLAFIDADKTNYQNYYEALLPRMRAGGVILVDNVLWGGSVVDETRDDEQTLAIRAFNDRIAADDRVEAVMLPISDGLTLIRVP